MSIFPSFPASCRRISCDAAPSSSRSPARPAPRYWVALALVAITISAVLPGCTPGGAAKALRGDVPRAADALGESVCMLPGEPTEPWTFDLDTTQRGQVTAALRKPGLILARYDCNKLEVVRGCKAAGDYEYAAYPAAWDTIELRDGDEIRASLSGGTAIAAAV